MNKFKTNNAYIAEHYMEKFNNNKRILLFNEM